MPRSLPEGMKIASKSSASPKIGGLQQSRSDPVSLRKGISTLRIILTTIIAICFFCDLACLGAGNESASYLYVQIIDSNEKPLESQQLATSLAITFAPIIDDGVIEAWANLDIDKDRIDENGIIAIPIPQSVRVTSRLALRINRSPTEELPYAVNKQVVIDGRIIQANADNPIRLPLDRTSSRVINVAVISDRTNRPVPHTDVWLLKKHASENYVFAKASRTDADGLVSFSVTVNEDVRIRLADTEPRVEIDLAVDESDDFVIARTLVVPAPSFSADFVMPATISGDTLDVESLNGQVILSQRRDDGTFIDILPVNRGRVQAYGLKPGTVTLQVSPDSSPLWQSVRIAPGQTIEINRDGLGPQNAQILVAPRNPEITSVTSASPRKHSFLTQFGPRSHAVTLAFVAVLLGVAFGLAGLVIWVSKRRRSPK